VTTGPEVGASVRGYYDEPGVVARYAAAAAEGLAPFEAALVRRAFGPGDRVLDVGCGGGREAVALVRAGLRVVAVDLSPSMARAAADHAQAQGSALAAAAADAAALPFRDGRFDGVAMFGQVIAHVPTRAGRVAALRSAWRALRPGGALALTTHNRRCHPKFQVYFACVNRWRRLARRAGLAVSLGDFDRLTRRDQVSGGAAGRRLFIHMYDQPEAEADLTEAGFTAIEARARAEWESGREDPAARRRDYLLGYLARRPEGPA